MDNSITIPKDPVNVPSMDWTLLRREGIRHIENLGSDIWTDYNIHDPGITILEALCYAITDIGYRSNMRPADLFAQVNNNSFFTAAEILPCRPVTAPDFRKVLIDIPGVQNAWVEQLHDPEVRFSFRDPLSIELVVDTLAPYVERLNAAGMDMLVTDLQRMVPDLDATLIRNLGKCQDEKEENIARETFWQALMTFYFTPHRKITGVITDANGLLIADLTVGVVGRAVATSTDINGAFTINAYVSETLKISGAGYDTVYLQQSFRKDDYRIIVKLSGIAGQQESYQPDLVRVALLLYMIDRNFDELIFYLQDVLTEKGNEIEGTDIAGIITSLRKLKELWQSGVVDMLLRPELRKVLEWIDSNQRLAAYVYLETFLQILFIGNLRTQAYLPEAANTYNLFVPQGVYDVSVLLEPGNEAREQDIINEILRTLHMNRNIGEDFHPGVHIIENIPTGIDLTVEIDATYDSLEVLAAVFRAIETYLAATIRFYSLEEMMNRHAVFEVDKSVLENLRLALLPESVVSSLQSLNGKIFYGDESFRRHLSLVLDSDTLEDYYADIFTHAKRQYNADPVYRGPLLNHGFIDEMELIGAQPRQTIFKSDLYQLIAGIKGVTTIHTLEIFRVKDPDHRTGNWCLSFPCRCLPELDLQNSGLNIYVNGIVLAVNTDKLEEYMDAHPRMSTRLDRRDKLDLPVPAGKVVKDIREYTSTQEDFPRTYKIGRTGISARDSEQRKAAARQLKGYLFFYDQLLANYLAQLSGVRHLFSVGVEMTNGKDNPIINYQPLYEIPGIKELLLDFENGSPNSWNDFINDKDNPYIKVLRQLAEGNETSRKIFRSKVLDHLLGRFGEQFTDYVLQLYRIEKPIEQKIVFDEDEDLDESIRDKQRFLRNIPVLGSQRAAGFNYYPDATGHARYWNTDNVEMVKRRVSAILGMQSDTRHTITCEPEFNVISGEVRSAGSGTGSSVRYEFYIRQKGNNAKRLLVSTAKFRSPAEAEKAKLEFLNVAVNKSGYGIVNDNQVGFWINIPEDDRTVQNAMMLEPQEDETNPEERLKFIRELASGNCEDDGFHIIEHILLRPRSDAWQQWLKPVLCCIKAPELLDSYSFWITVVLPDWSGRFSDPGRLQVFEQTVRREMPAHLSVRFCLLNREEMFAFEKSFNGWLRNLCSAGQQDLPQATDALVALMNDWDDNKIHYF